MNTNIALEATTSNHASKDGSTETPSFASPAKAPSTFAEASRNRSFAAQASPAAWVPDWVI
jgi:hypothetical protein